MGMIMSEVAHAGAKSSQKVGGPAGRGHSPSLLPAVGDTMGQGPVKGPVLCRVRGPRACPSARLHSFTCAVPGAHSDTRRSFSATQHSLQPRAPRATLQVRLCTVSLPRVSEAGRRCRTLRLRRPAAIRQVKGHHPAVGSPLTAVGSHCHVRKAAAPPRQSGGLLQSPPPYSTSSLASSPPLQHPPPPPLSYFGVHYLWFAFVCFLTPLFPSPPSSQTTPPLHRLSANDITGLHVGIFRIVPSYPLPTQQLHGARPLRAPGGALDAARGAFIRAGEGKATGQESPQHSGRCQVVRHEFVKYSGYWETRLSSRASHTPCDAFVCGFTWALLFVPFGVKW